MVDMFFINMAVTRIRASQVTQLVKNQPAMWESWV